MHFGAPRTALDIDERCGQIAARGAARLGERDAARVVAAAFVTRVQQRDSLCGRCVGRIGDAIGRALEVDGQHRRAGVDIAGELALGEHARGAVQEIDRRRCQAHGDFAFEQRDLAGHRHRFSGWRRLGGPARTASNGHLPKMLEGSPSDRQFSYMSGAAGPIAAFPSSVRAPRNYEIPRTWVIVLVLAAAALMAPFAGWVVLARWMSGFARGLHDRIAHRLHGRVQLAALITVFLLTLVLVPVGAILTMLVLDAIALVAQLAESDKVHSVLVSLVSDKNPNPDASIGELILMQGDRAWGIAQMIITSAAQIVIGLVILLCGIFAILVDGQRWYKWADDHSPIGSKALHRMGDAFTETGRGL